MNGIPTTGEALVGHTFAYLIALAAFLAIGAVLFYWRRTQSRALSRKLQ